ncbi:MAG: hypothetical protein U0869_10620 [Chloroflexota bacterium]
MHRSVALVGVVAAIAFGSAPASAQSPSPSPQPSPVASPSPRSAAPPMLALSEAPPAWTPSGNPTVWTERDGLRLEAWLSSTVLQPGDWIQARVRATNTGSRTRFYAPNDCPRSPISVTTDLSGLFRPGIDWPGLAGRFKRELLADGDLPSWQLPDGEEGLRTTALADCSPELGPRVGRLEPGESVERTWSYRPTYLFRRPLPPGPIGLRIGFSDRGDASRPDRRHAPLELEAALLLTGTDPGYPSPGELIDAALGDARLFAFVNGRPAQRSWVNVEWIGWGDVPSDRSRFDGLAGRVDDGFVEIGLFRDIGDATVFGAVSIDPWTGEVLAYGEDQ